MSNQYFSPNAKINGGALFASFNSKEGSVYLKVLKQIANNPDKKNNFDGKNPIHIKLSQDEIADIVRVVRTNGACSFYHKFNDSVTTLGFKHYTIDGPQPRSGFGMTVKRDVTEVKVGFTLGSAERLSLFLQNALTHIFDAEYRQDIKDNEEFKKKKESAPAATLQDTPPEEPQEPAEPEIDF